MTKKISTFVPSSSEIGNGSAIVKAKIGLMNDLSAYIYNLYQTDAEDTNTNQIEKNKSTNIEESTQNQVFIFFKNISINNKTNLL